MAAAGKYRWCAESGASAALSAIASGETVVTSTSVTAAVTVATSGGCAAAFENSASWVQGDNIRLKGALSGALNTTNAGTYDITVYVRDNQNNTATALSTTDPLDNIVSRAFVLAIHGS